MTDLITAAQQALEALTMMRDEYVEYACPACDHADAAIYALRAALAEPEQEPVADSPDPYHLSRILHELAGSASMCWEHVDRAGVFQSTQAAEFVAAAIAEIRQRIKAAPPQRKPLTEEELDELAMDEDGLPNSHLEFARAIERAHGIGGHDEP